MKRYLISMGLMETDPRIIKNRKLFKEVSKLRTDAAEKVDSVIREYCRDSGVKPVIKSRYDKDFPLDSVTFENPKKPTFQMMDPEIMPWGLPLVYQPVPDEFTEAVVKYKNACSGLELNGKNLGLFSWMRFNRSMGKIGGIYYVQDFTGVVAEPDKIIGLETEVKSALKDLDASHCIVSQVSY